ncbi:MAG TPA: nucleotide exchange factor GrpE [Thioploca sp.]|nr:MAG: nucleotide exchange factor GrpE [Gammaproteobacteria bacterium]HDN25546.1 nucleotide exchange factor GrpE [Thioploca sp.]
MTSDDSVSALNEKPAPPTKPNEKPAPPAESAAAANAVSDTPGNNSAQVESTEATDKAAQTAAQVVPITTGKQCPTVPEASDEVTELTRKYAEATQKAESYWDSLLRRQAEYDNLQKRMVRDVDNARKYALEKFATELLAVKDSMELGIEAAAKPETNLDSVREGMGLTLKMLVDTLSKFNINEINPIDEPFNPEWHEAMAMQPVPNVSDGIVLHVHQKGYELNERLLRPARVVVAKAIPAEKPLDNEG